MEYGSTQALQSTTMQNRFRHINQLRYHAEVYGPTGYKARIGLPGIGKAVRREYVQDGFSNGQEGRYREEALA